MAPPPVPKPERPGFLDLMDKARAEMLALVAEGEMDPAMVTPARIAEWANDMDPM